MHIVEVSWVDAASTRGWRDGERVRKEKTGLLECRSVGYLLSKNAREVRIVQSQGITNGDLAEMQAIPTSTVKKIRRLKYPMHRLARKKKKGGGY